MNSHEFPRIPKNSPNKIIDSPQKSTYNHPYLTGTYIAKIDNKKRLKIPKQIVDSIMILNKGEKRIYLQKNENKIVGYTLKAVEKLRKELGDLPLRQHKTRDDMEKLGSTLSEIHITSDDRIKIPDELLSSLKIKVDSEIIIKGAFEFITISKYNK